MLYAGIAILAVVFTGLFAMTATIDGWRTALGVWTFAVIVTAGIVLGVVLTVNGAMS